MRSTTQKRLQLARWGLGVAWLTLTGCQLIRTDNLNQALARGETEKVHQAIASGVNVNGRGMHAMTPLMKAAGVGRLDYCELLVKHGANVNGHNDTSSVLGLAVHSGNEELVRFLLKSGADRSWTNVLGETVESRARKRGLTNMCVILLKKEN
jgi:ankyrin repeat protein